MRPPFSPVRLVPLVGLADAVLRRMVRWSVDDPDGLLAEARAGRPFVFACHHGQLWPLLWVVADCQVTILASRSSDGELLARILRRRRFEVVRGSSSRDGAAAARQTLRILRRGGRVGVAVDGPRGPRGVVQTGVLRLARGAGAPIVPLRVEGGRPWVAPGSWDAFEIPRPFDRVDVRVGPAITVGHGRDGLARSAELVAAALGVREHPAVALAGATARSAVPSPAERG